MRFIHSNKQYIERTMYPINPYMNTPAVVPLTMEAFVAPANFDPDAQELNIVKAFAAYPDANKKYIFSVAIGRTTINLPVVSSRCYYYSENGNAYQLAVNNSITFITNSVKRVVICCDSNDSIQVTGLGACAYWIYLSKKVTAFGSEGQSLYYIHCESLTQFTTWINYAFYSDINLTGIFTLPPIISSILSESFSNCYKITQMNFHSGLQSILYAGLKNCTGLVRLNCHAILPPTLGAQALSSIKTTTCILHVPVGSLAAYQAAQYWNGFTNIIDDL